MLKSEVSFEVFKDCGLSGATRIIGEVFGDGEFSNIPQHILDEAINRGKKVHESIENFILTGEVKIEFKYAPYMAAFMEWYNKYTPEFIASELMLMSEELGYKGIIDMVAKIDNEIIVIDTKTSSNLQLLKPTIQLNMYLLLLIKSNLITEPIKKIKVLKLSKASYKYIDIEVDEELVYALLKLRKAKKELG